MILSAKLSLLFVSHHPHVSISESFNVTCCTTYPVRPSSPWKCLKLPEAPIVSFTSLKTHEMLHRQAVSLPLAAQSVASELRLLSSIRLPDGQKLLHFIQPFAHLLLWVTNEITTSLHSETYANMPAQAVPSRGRSIKRSRILTGKEKKKLNKEYKTTQCSYLVLQNEWLIY